MTIDQCPTTVKESPKQQPGRAALALRQRSLAGTVNGMVAFRSPEEFADTPEFREMVEREFPVGASELLSSSRRTFVQLMGASLALAGVSTIPGCRRPDHKILPYSKHIPEDTIPGKAMFYATSMPLPGGGAEGLFVECHDHRPTKIEGNPLHPINQGKSSVMSQAAVLSLYDPDRLKNPNYKPTGKDASWDDFAKWAGEHFAKLDASKGERLAFVVDKKTSPSRSAVRERVMKRFPKATWVSWDPVEARGQLDGTTISFGTPMREILSLAKARVVLTLDRDFLANDPGQLVNAREFAATRVPRKVKDGEYAMSRLYAVESGCTLTGGQADHKLRLAPSRIVGFAIELAKFVVAKTGAAGSDELSTRLAGLQGVTLDAAERAFLEEAAKDLLDTANRGGAVVLAGRTMPAEVHALCHAINACLGTLGTLVKYQAMDAEQASDAMKGLKGLADAMAHGKIDTLVVVDANPCHDAPADLTFAESYAKIAATVCMSVGASETAAASTWSLPGCHFLEAWGDTKANDGSIAPIQPMIAPLFGSQLTETERSLPKPDQPRGAMSELELLAFLAGEEHPDGYAIVRDTWREMGKAQNPSEPTSSFEQRWRRALQDGIALGMAPVYAKDVRFGAVATAVGGMKIPDGPAPGTLDVVFAFGNIHDGRFANNAWLQELPETGTMICWDNPALMSPKTAGKLGLWDVNGKTNRYTEEKWPHASIAEFTLAGRSVKVPVWILPGMADDTVILKHGYGRNTCGVVGDGVGFDTYPIRASDTNGGFASGVTVKKLDEDHWIASTQNHWSLESRTSLLRVMDLPAYARHAGDADVVRKDKIYGTESKLNLAERLGELSHTPPNVSIYDNPYAKSPVDPAAGSAFAKGPQWGMTIDLSSCTGCGVCTIACQSENNIPVVGKKEVAKGREMTWMRVDRYFTGWNEGNDLELLNNPEAMFHQPVACVHCEYAPCETVCPVNATTHTTDGLNTMAYNRCIGTRYCANNCPYKARRFNYFDYGVTKFNGNYFGKDAVESASKVIPNENSGVAGSTRHGRVNPNLIPPRLREKLDQISKMQKNPNVTVRSRGVMEKCTYCVQRINEARIGWNTQDGLEPAKRNQVPDGFFETACQQACPSNSIVFGDILDATNEYTTAENTKRVGSKIHATRGDARSYMLIGYLATRPRTTHMMKVRNPNRSLLLRGGTSGEDRVKGWENPFHHGSGGHGEEPAAPAGAGTPGHSMFDRKRTEDGSVSLALRVLGGVHA